MSLIVPSVSVKIDDVAIPSTRIKKFYCTDEDLTYGLGKCEVEIADPDGTAASTYPSFGTEQGLMKKITIIANGRTIFEGYIESVDFEYHGGDTILLIGYSRAVDFVNVFITKDYSSWIGKAAGPFLTDVLTNAGRTFPHIISYNLATGAPPYPSSIGSPGPLEQKYVLDIMRDVCSVTKYAATVDPAGNFYFFNPSDGGHNINYAVQSVYPSAANDFKDGRATRNLQDTKNYLEVNGAGVGYDPFINDGGLTNPGYNGYLTGSMQWSADVASAVTTTTDVPVTETIYITRSIKVVPNTFDKNIIRVGAQIGEPILVGGKWFGSLVHNGTYEVYQIKSDIDAASYRINLPFNAKTSLNLFANCSSPSMPAPGWVWPIFTDLNGNRASAMGQASPAGTWQIPTASTWTQYDFPIPNADDLAAMGPSAGARNYYFTDYNLNPITTGFNFSTIIGLEFYFATGGAPTTYYFKSIELAGVWFNCTPQYFTPTKTVIAAGLPYSRRDQAVNAGNQYVNQLDVQGYGDGIYPQYQNPMLRVPITVIVDPNVTFFKAGWFIGLNIPRWGFTPTIMPSWRILQVRWDWGPGGLTCKADVIPATAG